MELETRMRCLVSWAKKSMPPVHAWSADGTETPIFIVSWGLPVPQVRLAAYKDTIKKFEFGGRRGERCSKQGESWISKFSAKQSATDAWQKVHCNAKFHAGWINCLALP